MDWVYPETRITEFGISDKETSFILRYANRTHIVYVTLWRELFFSTIEMHNDHKYEWIRAGNTFDAYALWTNRRTHQGRRKDSKSDENLEIFDVEWLDLEDEKGME